MSSPSSTTIAFFGATGGCTNACLTHTLKAGYNAIALARTPSKLTTQLLAQDLTQDIIDSQLTIVQGDVTKAASVEETLLARQDGTIPSMIVFGIGSSPKVQASTCAPITIDNPEICEQGTKALQSALQNIYTENPSTRTKKPLLTFISTTGIANGKNDVPFGFNTFYHVVLSVPHKDKRKMEDAITANMQGEEEDRAFRGFVCVRPSLLTGDHTIKSGRGWNTLKVGTEAEPAVGYTIQRADVGHWIFEEIVRRGGDIWVGKKVTLTG